MRRGFPIVALAGALLLIIAGLTGCGDQKVRAEPVRQAQAKVVPTAQRVFGLVRPADTADRVLVARATERQPGGPETLTPVKVQPYVPVPLAPGVKIRVTAPIYEADLTDWIRGGPVTPDEFADLSRKADKYNGPLPDRARMFHIWLDGSGRVSRLQHIFSP